ncbi:hypothetical protein DY000_02031960 [Brassica cretica]|uniref:Uncharacterized protein n=1 Tax=Brassica cretica TaxID=69181 RepID=A0ABQ7DPD6_BRACR|nr:hypothetical protein DY000_02031960 [Brassica cretica]
MPETSRSNADWRAERTGFAINGESHACVVESLVSLWMLQNLRKSRVDPPVLYPFSTPHPYNIVGSSKSGTLRVDDFVDLFQFALMNNIDESVFHSAKKGLTLSQIGVVALTG